MPLYCILSNAVLDELAQHRPTSRDALLAVKGMGPVKVERYGDALLEIIGGAGHERDGEWDRGRRGEVEQ